MEPSGEKGKRGTEEVHGRVEEGQAAVRGTGSWKQIIYHSFPHQEQPK